MNTVIIYTQTRFAVCLTKDYKSGGENYKMPKWQRQLFDITQWKCVQLECFQSGTSTLKEYIQTIKVKSIELIDYIDAYINFRN